MRGCAPWDESLCTGEKVMETAYAVLVFPIYVENVLHFWLPLKLISYLVLSFLFLFLGICKKSVKDKCKRTSKSLQTSSNQKLQNAAVFQEDECKENNNKNQHSNISETTVSCIKSSQSKSPDKEKKPFACSICGKKFTNLPYIQIHKATKHKELMKRNGKNEQLTTYSCDFCPKVFRWRYQLKYHKEKKHIDLKKGKHVHADKRKFSCDLCNKEYTSKQNLQFHQSRVHSHRIGKNRWNSCFVGKMFRFVWKDVNLSILFFF